MTNNGNLKTATRKLHQKEKKVMADQREDVVGNGAEKVMTPEEMAYIEDTRPDGITLKGEVIMWPLTKGDWDVIIYQGVWPMSIREQIKEIMQEYANNQDVLSLDKCADIIYDLVKDYLMKILKK